MKNSNLYSQYYIGTGEQTKMYTLRHQFEEIISMPGTEGTVQQVIVMRDYYIQNLSIDADRAQSSAAEMGYTVSKPQFTLEEIIKRNSDEVEAQRLAAEERFRNTQKMKLDHEINLIIGGMFPFGQNEGRELSVLYEKKGDSWAAYWMKEGRRDEPTATVKLLGSRLETMFPKITEITFLDKTGNGKYFGQVGKRQKNIKARLVDSLCFEGTFGYTYIEKFLSTEGEILLYMGSVCQEARVGEYFEMSFSIKEQSVYKGEHQTRIQRIKTHQVSEDEIA